MLCTARSYLTKKSKLKNLVFTEGVSDNRPEDVEVDDAESQNRSKLTSARTLQFPKPGFLTRFELEVVFFFLMFLGGAMTKTNY